MGNEQCKFEIDRAREEHKEYIKNVQCYLKNTAYIALDENGQVICSAEFNIHSMKEAFLERLNTFTKLKGNDLKNLCYEFIKEFRYWNPFINKIYYKIECDTFNIEVLKQNGFVEEKEKNYLTKILDSTVKVFKVNINEIQPGQLTVCRDKLEKVSKWVQCPENIIVNFIEMDGKIVSIDGHTRLVAALLKGYSYVYGYYEINDYYEGLYKECLNWCQQEGIFHVSDLKDRVVTPQEHEKLWISRCQNYLKNMEN